MSFPKDVRMDCLFAMAKQACDQNIESPDNLFSLSFLLLQSEKAGAAFDPRLAHLASVPSETSSLKKGWGKMLEWIISFPTPIPPPPVSSQAPDAITKHLECQFCLRMRPSSNYDFCQGSPAPLKEFSFLPL